MIPRSFYREHEAWQLKKVEEDKSGWLAFLIQKNSWDVLCKLIAVVHQGLHGDVELMNGLADDL